jgi:hypothetical protein
VGKSNDKSFYESQYARREGDAYYTQEWLTRALVGMMERNGTPLSAINGVIWEPAAGRGDMARVLQEQTDDAVFCSDINLDDLSDDFAWREPVDFLNEVPMRLDLMEIGAIITNPPFLKNNHIQFVRKMHEYDPEVAAVLVRQEFGNASTWRDIFERPDYAFELRLLTRPRWDWWFRDKPEHGPRHAFAWHVWDKRSIGTEPRIYRATQKEFTPEKGDDNG